MILNILQNRSRSIHLNNEKIKALNLVTVHALQYISYFLVGQENCPYSEGTQFPLWSAATHPIDEKSKVNGHAKCKQMISNKASSYSLYKFRQLQMMSRSVVFGG